MIGRVGEELLAEVDIREGVRLLGIGVSNFTRAAQERLFEDETPETGRTETEVEVDTSGVRGRGFFPGADVIHDALGRGWVWGSGLGRVTVRFETRHTGPGPVRTFSRTIRLCNWPRNYPTCLSPGLRRHRNRALWPGRLTPADRRGGIGRHAGFRFLCLVREGSSPFVGTLIIRGRRPDRRTVDE